LNTTAPGRQGPRPGDVLHRPDIVCDAPAGRIEGAEGYRAFMAPFVQMLVRTDLIAAFGDDERRSSCTTPRPPGAERAGGRVRHRARREDRLQPVHLRPLPFEAARRS
jgi:hypothetical protein